MITIRPQVSGRITEIRFHDGEHVSEGDVLLVIDPRPYQVPLGAVVNITPTTGPDSALRYNGFRSADLNGVPGPGFSSGQAQEAIGKILEESLPKGMQFEWTDLT